MNPVQRERRLFLLHDVGGYPSHHPPPPPGATLTLDDHDMVVSGATNATPIVITTTTDHARVTGDKVTIAGVTGNTAANGDWVITKITDDTFSLDTSIGNGAYVANGTVVYTIDETEQLFKTVWATGTAAGVSFSLVNPPSGFSIVPGGANTGGGRHRTTITAMPPEQGSLPKVVTVRVRAKDGVNTVDKVVSFNLTDLNHSPDLWDEGDVIEYEKNIFQQLSIWFKSRDQDVPKQTLTYSLDATAGPYPNLGQTGYDGTPEGDAIPAGAVINSSTGRFTWTPTALGTTYITVRVTDNGTPNMDAIWTIKVEAKDAFQAGTCANVYGVPHVDITHSTETVGYESHKAFDSDPAGTGWRPSAALPQWIKHEFASAAKVIRHITLRGAMTASAFTVEGSNDDIAWTSLGTWSNKGDGVSQQLVFDTNNRDAYSYYRITFTANTGTLEITNIELDCNVDEGQIFAITDGGTVAIDTVTDNKLVSVETSTGALTLIGTITGLHASTRRIQGFAIDYRNQTTGNTTAYLITWRTSDYGLYTLNLETAVATSVSYFESTSTHRFEGASFDNGWADGRLYLFDRRAQAFGSLNVSTGAYTQRTAWTNTPYGGIGYGAATYPAFVVRSGNVLLFSSEGQYGSQQTYENLAGHKNGNSLWQINGQGGLGVGLGNRARLLDDTGDQSETLGPFCFRDTNDMTEERLWIFEAGSDDNQKIWKLNLLEGDKVEVSTYDQTTHGKIDFVAAPYRMPIQATKETELIKFGSGSNWPIGKFSNGDLVTWGGMTGHVKKTFDWQVRDADTTAEILSGTIAAGATEFPFALLQSQPANLIDRKVKLFAQSTYNQWNDDPPEFESPWLRGFHNDYLREIVGAKIYRGGVADATPGYSQAVITTAIENAPGIIDGTKSYELSPLDWVMLELAEECSFSYMWRAAGTVPQGSRDPIKGHSMTHVTHQGVLVLQSNTANPWIAAWQYNGAAVPGNSGSWYLYGADQSHVSRYTEMDGFSNKSYDGLNSLHDVHSHNGNKKFYQDNKETRRGRAGFGKFIACHFSYYYPGAANGANYSQRGAQDCGQIKIGY